MLKPFASWLGSSLLGGSLVLALGAGAAQAASLSTSGTWSTAVLDNGAVLAGGTNAISWGTSAGYGQSGYVFTGVSATVSNFVNPFKIGTFTHNNFPIYGNALDFATLNVNLNLDSVTQSFSFLFDHLETPNSGLCEGPGTTICPDRVTFPNASSSQTVVLGGIAYNLTLTGFLKNGYATTSFWTEEGQANSADLYARLTAVPEPLTVLGTAVALGLGTVFRRRHAATK